VPAEYAASTTYVLVGGRTKYAVDFVEIATACRRPRAGATWQHHPVSDQQPQFDSQLAATLIGKHVIVGLTYMRADEVESKHQCHGFVVQCDETIVAIEPWGGGDPITLPPDLRPFEAAPPGEYRLRSTGEVVVDPDYTASWTIHLAD
jgi:hypothetical protein